MSYCTNCGKEIQEGAFFCIGCGAPVNATAPAAPEQTVALAATEQTQTSYAESYGEAREFLDNTHKLLRWEMKAWNIASKFFIVFGIIFAAIFSLYILVGLIVSAEDSLLGGFFTGFGTVSTVLYGGMFIGLGIVSKKAAEKIPQYLNTLYTDFSIAYNRCGNVGMLIFNVLLGVVSPIFFIINFVRMKANRNLIETIIQNQNMQG